MQHGFHGRLSGHRETVGVGSLAALAVEEGHHKAVAEGLGSMAGDLVVEGSYFAGMEGSTHSPED